MQGGGLLLPGLQHFLCARDAFLALLHALAAAQHGLFQDGLRQLLLLQLLLRGRQLQLCGPLLFLRRRHGLCLLAAKDLELPCPAEYLQPLLLQLGKGRLPLPGLLLCLCQALLRAAQRLLLAGELRPQLRAAHVLLLQRAQCLLLRLLGLLPFICRLPCILCRPLLCFRQLLQLFLQCLHLALTAEEAGLAPMHAAARERAART